MYFLSNTIRKALVLTLLTTFIPLATPMVLAQAQAPNQAVYDVMKRVGKGEKAIQAFYASTNYKSIWIGSKNKARRNALLKALKYSGDQGLPTTRYNVAALNTVLKAARNGENVGAAEMLATKTYLQYAHDSLVLLLS